MQIYFFLLLIIFTGFACSEQLDTEADLTGKGPANFMLKDPDGNLILIDQHVNKPE